MKTCTKCTLNKNINLFMYIKSRNCFNTICKSCINKRKKIYNEKVYNAITREKYKKNCKTSNYIKKRKIETQKYYKKHCEEIKQKVKEYRDNKDKVKKYAMENKDKINKSRRPKNKENLKNPILKLRKYTSIAIRYALKNKSKQSILKYLPYTIDELKFYLESLFEPWMTWNNWGKYSSKTWNDNDQLTWVWNIDHIIPQSALKYASMDDENFKKCWSLDNLRPLKAKENIIKGRSLCPSRWKEAKQCGDVEKIRLNCNIGVK